jgi:hypothetical protein
MSIAIQVHDNSPSALAELIAKTMRLEDGTALDREPLLAHLAAVVDAEEREGSERREAWHWLNSISKPLDRDNDWSDI